MPKALVPVGGVLLIEATIANFARPASARW
jgi:hypothetical protein